MSSVDELFQQVKAYLLQSDSEGHSAFDHLEKIVLTLLDENPGDVANHPEKLAEISSLIKRHGFHYGQSEIASNNPATLHDSRLQQLLANKDLFNKPAPEVVTTIEQPTPFSTVTTTTVKPPVAPPFASVVRDNAFWRHCGIGLNEQEAFLLEQSISRLAMRYKLEEVRFAGKIFGTKGNYLVVTSKRHVGENEKVYQEVNTMPKPPRKKVEVDVQAEPGYKGLNRLSYWVASNAASEWVLLPDITPQQLNAARNVKKMFTGVLDAPVVCSPAFDGNESIYLRAQLSRILSATFIAPTGALEKVEPEEDEAAEEEEDDGKKKGPKEAKYFPATRASKEYAPDEEAGVHALLDLEQWVHSEAHIFENGRQTKIPEKPEVEGEEEEPKEDEEEEEPQEEEEKKEEEEKELFLPVKKDYLYAVINIPKEPSPEDGEEEAGEEEAAEEDGEQQEEEENKPLDDEEIPDDDPLKKKVAAWSAKAVNTTYKKHSVVVVKSLRWPGAVAFAANGAKAWGSIYFGNGLKKTDHSFTPVPAPPIQKEAPDIVEVMDATAATEKLVLRGEEPKENDSEDEKEEEEPEEDA